jgi:hypothetical protein
MYKYAWLPIRVRWLNGVKELTWFQSYWYSPHDNVAYVSRLDDPTERRLERESWIAYHNAEALKAAN